MDEAHEMAYHYINTQLGETMRPAGINRQDGNGFGEGVWKIEIVSRASGEKQGDLLIGVETGSTYSWQPVS